MGRSAKSEGNLNRPTPLDWITGVHPLWYLLAFVVTPFVFAGLYTYVVPKGFYAPYAKLEAAASADGLRLMEAIHKAIKDFFAQHNARVRAAHEPVGVGREIRLLEMSNSDWGNGSELELRILMRVGDVQGESAAPAQAFTIVLTPWERIQDIDGRFRWSLLDRGEKFSDLLLAAGWVPDSSSQDDPASSKVPYVSLGYADDLFFRLYLEGIRGDATGFSGRYSRLLYFSVITITTVGYGDIVPITDFARILVALEAIAGIILAGLFLNSLFAYRKA